MSHGLTSVTATMPTLGSDHSGGISSRAGLGWAGLGWAGAWHGVANYRMTAESKDHKSSGVQL